LKDKSNEDGMPEENLNSTKCRHSPAYAISSYAVPDLRNFKEAKSKLSNKIFETRAGFLAYGN
jgi:hypothetical protein